MIWTLAALLSLAVAVLMVRQLRRESRQQALLMERMRDSETYRLVRPLFKACREERVECIELRSEAITATLFSPPGKQLQLRFEKHGMDPLELLQLQTLAQLAAEELPELGDNRRYFFKEHREHTASGDVVRWYTYMIQPGYKDEVLRSAYDRK